MLTIVHKGCGWLGTENGNQVASHQSLCVGRECIPQNLSDWVVDQQSVAGLGGICAVELGGIGGPSGH